MSKETQQLQPHEVESRFRRMIRESSEELTEIELAERSDRVTKSHSVQFDPEIFDIMLRDARKEMKIYEVLGKDFRSDLRNLTKMIDGLECISNLFKSHNLKDLTRSSEVTEVSWLSQVKVRTDPIRMHESNYKLNEDYAIASGVFTTLNIYVIPFAKMGLNPVVSPGRTNRNILNQMKQIVKSIETHPDRMGVPRDAILGSFKLISSEVAVVVARDPKNPFTDGIHSFKNWRFITPSGESI